MEDKSTVVEGNKIFAEFMGGKFLHDFNPTYITFKDIQFADLSGNYSCQLEDCYFHSSWSWLMPAWSKFYNEIILSEWYQDYYTKESSTDLDCMEYSLTCVHIQGAFKHFTNLLTWYNSESIHKQP